MDQGQDRNRGRGERASGGREGKRERDRNRDRNWSRADVLRWTVAAVVLVALAIPWFLWGNDTVVAGLPIWLWWHVGWMGLAAVGFWAFATRAWGVGIETGGAPAGTGESATNTGETAADTGGDPR